MSTNVDQNRFVTVAILGVIVMGFVFGKAIGGTIWMGFLGLGWSIVTVGIGAFVGIVYSLSGSRAVQKKAEKILDERRQELDNQQAIIDLEKENLARQRRGLGRDNAGLVRAITNRVANRILSKYVPDLGQNARRKKVFGEVDEIVSEELGRENVEALSTEP